MYKTMATPKPVPQVLITPDLYAKIRAYIDVAFGEISGLGEAEIIRGEDFLITELLLFEQEVTFASTDISQDALFDFLGKAVDSGFDLERIKLWWHSHGSGSVFWSPTDEETIALLSNSGWMISLVGNKRGEFLARLDVYKPVHITIHLALTILPPVLTEEELLEIGREVQAKVTFIEPTVLPNLGNPKDYMEIGGYDDKKDAQ